MAEQTGTTQPPPASFDYVLYEGDPDHLREVVATPTQITPWIDSASLKLKHRIGRGTFGDVWLATHHQSADDYDEYHEVAVKMLHLIKESDKQAFLDKFEELFMKIRGLQGVCWLHGISTISGKFCIAMKFYEGSVGDRMARLKSSKLPLSDVLRYGIELAKGIQELHSKGVLVLNLKPSNFLLDEQEQVILGDFGIPYMLLGISFSDQNMSVRLGTPNYMSPEQWEPEVRGPISSETDSWGFGCSIVEMLTGVFPWFGKSTKEVYQSVVLKQEKPFIPNGLPTPVENIIRGCFEYDLRNRPSMADILLAFESSRNAFGSTEGWIGEGNRTLTDGTKGKGLTPLFLSKDHLQVGDTVRSKKPLNLLRPQKPYLKEGTVVGLETETDRDGFLLVRVQGIHNPLRVHMSKLERVTSGLAAGDWVRLKNENNKHSAMGILHSADRDGTVAAGFVGLETLWKGKSSELQLGETYYVGDFVKVKENLITPRFNWPRKRGGNWSTGRIFQILSNGCLLVCFPGRFVFGSESNIYLADPAEVELVSFGTCSGVVKKYQHVEDYHWAVRPLVIALGLFTAMKVGFFVGKNVKCRMKKLQKTHSRSHSQSQESQNSVGSPWLPQPVANIIFREGVSTTSR